MAEEESPSIKQRGVIGCLNLSNSRELEEEEVKLCVVVLTLIANYKKCKY